MSVLPRRSLPAALLFAAASAVRAQPAVDPLPVPAAEPSAREPVAKESARDFLDSLADNALAPDPTQVYRKRGARREIDLRGGVGAYLDEAPASRIDSPVSVPGVADQPPRVFGLTLRRPSLAGDFAYGRSSVSRDTGVSLAWQPIEFWSLRTDLREQRSDIEEIDAKRRDSSASLRWSPLSNWWVDAGVHRASLGSASGDPASTTPEGSENFWRLRSQWQPVATPGLTLSAGAERSIARPASPLGAGRLEFGADYTLQPDNPFGTAATGTRLVWREAPKLGLLSEGQALDARAAYRRNIGIEVPDGTPGGAVYGQWRSRSVASDEDQLAVLGWRHAWRPAERWLLQGHIEQAVPVAGPNTVRSTTIGGRIWRGAFPDNTFVTDLELVNSEREDSAYASVKYTFRLADDWISALRLNSTRRQPHGNADAGSTTYKGSAALGWREPTARRFAVLGRYTLTGNENDDPALADRRAGILLIGANQDIGDRDALTLRWTRRWDRDEALPQFDPRTTTMTLARWVHELDDRWSVSAHVARRSDPLEGPATGFGAEVGFKLSRKAVLALGYNPRGFNDNELEVDERTKKGLTLRLRFSIDAALGRWLDPPRRRDPE